MTRKQADGEYIRKSDVLDLIEDMTDQFGIKHRVITEGMISLLPSVKPQEPKAGHWIWCVGSHKCSNCEEYTCFSHKELLRYCPNCGCRMVEPQESEG